MNCYDSISQTDHKFVEKIKEYIQCNYSENISIEQIAKNLNISFYYMCHLFKEVTGITVSVFRNECRIAKAKRLLVETNKSITEIAILCGFESPAYFSKVFTNQTGLSPTHFRSKKSDTVYFDFYRTVDDNLAEMMPTVKLTDGNLPIYNVTPDKTVSTQKVSMPDDKYHFLHEAAIIEFKGILFAAWYNNTETELEGYTPIRGNRSYDGGQTWTEPEIIADDPSGKILYCPPVFGICDGKLYLFINEMVGADLMHALNLYGFDEEKDAFVKLWSKPIPFKLNTNVVTLPNGKLMLPGRIGKMDDLPTIPAVLISDSGKINADWRVVKLMDEGILPDGEPMVYPETTAIVCDETVYVFCHNDFGESWTGPYAHDIPIGYSKLYSGTLSNGRNYIVTNIAEEARKRLFVFLSEPHNMKFTECKLLRAESAEDFPTATQWHYPVAVEAAGKLHIICTVTVEDSKRGAALISLPLN